MTGTGPFRRGAVAQITERGDPVSEIADLPRVSKRSLYPSKAQVHKSGLGQNGKDAEFRRLKRGLVRVPEERGVLKCHRVFCLRYKVSGAIGSSPMAPAFVAQHLGQFSVRASAGRLRIPPSGFYAWLRTPLNPRAQADKRQTELLQKAWAESGKAYGYRKLHSET